MTQRVAGANRRWRCQFRCRGSRRESAVAQLSTFYLRLGAAFADASADLGRLRTFLWPWTLHSPPFRFFSHALTTGGVAGMLGP
jgi:hypothetical protein